MTKQSVSRRETRASRNAAGFSLVEVMLALAFLAVVLVSISGLFVQAGQSIKGGREMTESLAQATNIFEDLHGYSYSRLCQNLGAADTDTSFTADTRDTTSFASRWQPEIQQALWQGYALIDLVPVGVNAGNPACAGVSPPTFQCGEGIRMVTRVFWNEGARAEQLAASTVVFR